MIRLIVRALVAVLVLGGCSGSGPGNAPPTIAIGPIEVTSVPCSPCKGDQCLPCRGPLLYSLTASVSISNSGAHVVAVRTASVELRQNGAVTTGGAEAPSVGSVPAQIPSKSSLQLEFKIQVLDGASPAHSIVRASATGAYDDGMSWQAFAELAVPYP